MAKGYWVGWYRSVSDQAALAAYAKLAGPAIEAAGGRFLARGPVEKTFEAGISERTVLVEFDSVEKATAAYQSDGYRKALDLLSNAAERDIRIVRGLD